jgi:putative DNA primase/helicase
MSDQHPIAAPRSGIDTEALRRDISLSAVIGSQVQLTRNGDEWLGLCPFHHERSPSFTINEAKGFYHCFGCGAHGDVIRFVADFFGLDFQAACRWLGAADRPSTVKPAAAIADAGSGGDCYDGLQAADPGGDTLQAGAWLRCWNPKRPERPWVSYRPALVFPYRASDRRLLGYVLRIDLPAHGDRPARKITPTIRYARLPQRAGDLDHPRRDHYAWCHWRFDTPRPLYGLDALAARPGDRVLVVEGEKAADAARRMLAGYPLVVITWPGGAKAMRHVDWSPLRGRDVLLWGDADDAGAEAMLGRRDGAHPPRPGVAQLCRQAGVARLCYLPWDRTRPRGWDAADAESEGWSQGDLLTWLGDQARPWSPAIADGAPADATTVERAASPICAPSAPADIVPTDPGGSDAPAPDDAEVLPFRVLGFNRGTYYYLPRATRQVVALSAAAHTRAHLLTLAPLRHWATYYPGRNGFDLEAASDALISAAHQAGLFTADRLRGRGAWRDRHRVVMHTGRRLYVDGRPHDPAVFEGDFIYEAAGDLSDTGDAAAQAAAFGDALATPASTTEANRLVQICRRLTWENDLSADLLAGWCIIALLCGVLSWRPHLWITGPAQAGKSTVIKEIIQRVVGIFALYMDGKTTEAGIRQMLGQDARPVILDELESEDPSAAQRVQQILDMARVSSSGGTVIKGSTAGKPISYTLRACFCFSSINTAVAHYADETRISKLVLRRNEAPDADQQYRDLMRDITTWFTPDYARRLLARSLASLDVLLANTETFKQAAASVLQSRRAADQIGTMLAGLHLCYSTRAISVAEAEAWIKARDWQDHTAINATGDEIRLLERLATRRIRVPQAGGIREVTIGQAIMAVHSQPEVYADWAAELGAHGFKLDGDDVLIANAASPLKKLLEGSPWASDWLRPLRMLPGAAAVPNTYFSPGIKSRATRVPVKLLGTEG